MNTADAEPSSCETVPTQAVSNSPFVKGWTRSGRGISALGFLLAIFLQPLTVSAESGINAVLNRDTVSLGGSATLTLTVRGNDLGNITLPQVDGLQFEQAGISRSSNFGFSFGNTGNSASRENTVQVTFRVVPQRDGTFTIPPFSCAIDGKTFATQPLTLKALKSGAGLAAAPAPAASPSAAAAVSSQAIFGKITGVPEKMYAGQVAPATVTFYINRQANMQLSQVGLPLLKNDAFAAPSLRPEQVRQQQDENYHIFTAVVPLTALKEGKFELAAEWPLTVVVPDDSNNSGDSNDPFNHPMFRNFLRRQVQKNITVSSDKLAVTVLPLPADGRPASYGGAIGEFTANVSVEPREVRVGDPLTVKLAVSGRGNFDRIAAPPSPDAAGWKTYPASGQFAPADSAGLEGVKTFSLPLIPQNGTIKQLPDMEFSYFNPLTVKYVTLHPELPAVTILPAEKNLSASAPSPSAPANDSQPALAPPRLEFGATYADLQPVTARAWFWGANSLPLLLGLAGFFLLRRHRQTQDAGYQARKQTDRNVARALRTLDTALANEDSAAFAESASRVLRERLAAAWNQRAESLTTADVRARLGADGQPVLALFETADAVTYAGRRLSRDEMMDFRQRLAEQLNRLGT